MTLGFDENDYFIEALADGIADAATAAQATGDWAVLQATSWGYIKSLLALKEISEVQNHPDWGQGEKDAITVLIIANTFAGFSVPTSIPMTYQAAWNAVNGVPDQYGGGTKEEFWDELADSYPDLFQLDGNGELTTPDFISSPPTQADYSDLEQPLARSKPPTPLEDVRGDFGQAQTVTSPLVVDVDSDGVELTTFNASTTDTFFDLDGDGFAEQTAWVSGDDGLLVRDLDASGTIDNVSELFGSSTIDGFALLSELDTNGDLRIDASDTGWSDLRIWQDANEDAVTQDGELLTLASLDIVSIDLAGVEASTSTINGNPISHTSTFKYDDGSTDDIVDAWFVHDEMNTYYTGSYTLDPDTLFLPTLRGFGKLADLHIAMSLDNDLLDSVETFGANWDFDAFADPATLNDDIEDILYEWAGVDGVSPTSRGPSVDAQHLEFLEEYFGEEFLQYGTNPNPFTNAAALLEEAWDAVFKHLRAQLIIQAGGSALFDAGAIAYDLAAGEFNGTLDLSQTAIDDLVAYATDTGVDTEAFWIEIADFIEHTKGLSNITGTEEGWLDTAIYDSGLTTQNWDDIVATYQAVGTGGVTTNGTSSDETLTGTVYDDELNGEGGADTLNGGAGSDILRSIASGNESTGDTFNPGSGGDRAVGSRGDDIYVYTSGDDVYYDNSNGSTDKIVLPTGIELSDLTFHRLGDTDLLIEVDALGTIQIEKQFNQYLDWYAIDTLEFDDASTFNLLTMDSPVTYGTDGDDTLEGITSGAAGDDVIYGLGGNDDIETQSGTNVVDGGAGNDDIYLQGDNDTLIASPGFDNVRVSLYKTATLEIPEPYSDDDVTFIRRADDPNELYVSIDGLGQIEVEKQFYSSSGRMASITFEDASPTIDLLNVQIETIGTDGNDDFSGANHGASKDDLLNPLGGDDTVSGGSGDDTFLYTGGHDSYDDSTGTDILDIASTWSMSDLSFRRYTTNINDLIVEIDENNSITLDRQFTSTNGEWETLRLHDGNGDIDIMNDLVVETHGTESNDTIYGMTFGASDDDIIYGYGGDDTLYGHDGNDTLYGGAGDDFLRGYAGDDTFIYSEGLDTVQDSAGGGSEVLWVTGGVTVSDVSFSDYSTYHTKITITASVDEITVNFLRHGSATRHIETIRFDDGFEADLPSYASWDNGTSGADTMTGSGSADVIIGFAGADDIDAGAGTDHVHGGAGNDTINGEGGADFLHGGDGDDTIDGDAGDDILYGGDGEDTLWGDTGADTFVLMADSVFNDVDVIKDFDTTESDVLDLSDLLSLYDPLTDAITDFVQITDDSTDSTVKVDMDGGADNFVTVATLEGATGLTDEAALESAGRLLTT